MGRSVAVDAGLGSPSCVEGVRRAPINSHSVLTLYRAIIGFIRLLMQNNT